MIYELARIYQLNVIVEGIETKNNFDHVQALGCNMVQGYYFSKPRSWDDVLNERCQLEACAQ
ncbi:EAL domain-containing protein [Psychromonas antarctica]|nr:EAL domain-containing protein [Psychromonas antarctica]